MTLSIQKVEKTDTIIHLAGASVADKRWNESYKKEISESRIQSSRMLFEKLKNSRHNVSTFISASAIGPIPMPIIIAGLVFATASLMLSRTRYGEYIYLLGDNPVAARLSGVNTGRMIVMVYVISGLCSALAGLILIARLDSAQPVIGMGYEFNAIAAVVVGGTSFAGGGGTLFGTLLGTLFIETLGNGLNLLNVSPLWEQVVKGVVIALALLSYKALNRYRRNKERR